MNDGSGTITCHSHVASYQGENIRKFYSPFEELILTRFCIKEVNMEDDARLHIAALSFKDVANKWIFAMAETFTWKYTALSLPNKFLLTLVTVR